MPSNVIKYRRVCLYRERFYIYMKKAVITGVTGQDGSYLAEFLLDKGYEVHGLIRRHSTINTERIDHLLKNDSNKRDNYLNLHYADMTDSSNLIRIMSEIRPDEVYNLAAQSHVGISFEIPEYTAEATGVATIKLLEAVRLTNPKCRFYQDSFVDEIPFDYLEVQVIEEDL